MTAPRGHPTYCRWHENLPTHPKTLAAAAVLERDMGLSHDHANALVCRAVPLLVTWLIRNRDDGRTDDLSDADFAAICQPLALRPGGALWGSDEAALGVWRRALRAVPEGYDQGFLVRVGQGKGRPWVEGLHEFVWHAWPALRNRPHYKGRTLSALLARGILLSGGRPEDPAVPQAPCAEPVEKQGDLGLDPRFSAVPSGFSGASSDVPPDLSLGSKARTSADFGALQERSSTQEGSRRLNGSRAPAARGPWHGVPEGVRRGEVLALGGWLRGIPPNSQVELRAGDVYLRRYREHAVSPIPEAAFGCSALQPARLLEILEPDVWADLIADLAPRMADINHPRTYAMRALARRWDDVLSKLEDLGVARRADQAGRRRAVGEEDSGW